MNAKEFNQLYTEVKQLSKHGETSDGTDSTTSLHDWLKEGDIEGRTAQSLANEWDELCEEAETE